MKLMILLTWIKQYALVIQNYAIVSDVPVKQLLQVSESGKNTCRFGSTMADSLVVVSSAAKRIGKLVVGVSTM